MQYRRFGTENISSVGLGTWQFGSREWAYGHAYLSVTAKEIVRRALELGINFIDTAEMYGFGSSERAVGDAVRADRSKVFLATKFFPLAPLPPILVERCYKSANRLGTDCIDLYQLHFPNPVVPLSLQVGGLRTVLDRGVVQYAGVSNFSLDYWKRAEMALKRPIISNQVNVSIISQQALDEMLPWAVANDRIIIAYSPLERGLLSAKYDSNNKPPGFRRWTRNFSTEFLTRARPLFSLLEHVASQHDATPAQIALAWLLGHENLIVIPGAASVEQVEANVAASNIRLTEGEFQEIKEEGAKLSKVKR